MSADFIAAFPSLQTLAVLWLGAFLGGLAAGGAGFAFGIVGSAIWLHAITPLHTTILIVSGGTLIQIGTIWPLRYDIKLRRLAPFAIAGLLGVPVGVALLVHVDAHALKFALGIFIAVYGVYALATPRLPHIGGGIVADSLIGFGGGVLGGIGGYSGVLPAIWCQLRGWSKQVSRGIYQPFILMAHVTTMALIGVVALDRAGVVLFLLAVPMLVLGAFFGWRIYGRLDEHRFRQAFALLLVVSGVILVL
ncbi:MAG TPA: sulfite exporter TauE/SafE family protein [Xanthobacteraceae bacterium]|nr:sulfite exporter TauE/SafE family protein [Xanthobacteraceae bacterium]